MNLQTTAWFPADIAPAYIGWYEVKQEDGTTLMCWRGRIRWALSNPADGIQSDLIGVPGTHWRGLAAPTLAAHYESTAPAREVAEAQRVLYTGR